MSKVAIVYWSGTGNTEMMAKAVAEGVESVNSTATLIYATDFDEYQVDTYDAIAFGCPSMGDEVLEEYEFYPMFESLKDRLSDKKVSLFGSYSWGDGQWMRDWEIDTIAAGAIITSESLIVNETPDDNDLQACRQLGIDLAKA